MLKSLFIQNYAIIQDLQIDFNGGLSTITGETGAGKSILLGALSLLIGNRADSNVLFDDSRKCIVEGIFQIGGYGLEDFFKENDIDFAEQTVVRREINPDGKSRAFVNDSPVNLSLLKVMGEQLIDIHSQHENLYIENPVFQLRILDTFAKQLPTLQLFSEKFRNYKNLLSEYHTEKEKAEKNKADLDYFQFQYNQLIESKLRRGEQEELEEELKLLTHAEEIKSHLAQVLGLLSGDEISVIAMLKDALSNLSRIQAVFSVAESYGSRIDASFIELKDIAKEIETNYEKIDFDPERAELVRQRIDLIYGLQQKHRVSSVDELIHIQEDLKNRIDHITNSDEKLSNLKKAIDIEKSVLENISGELSRNRKNVIPQIEARVQELLFQLGMPNAVFKVEIISGDEFNSYGSDKVRFLFSANKQTFPLELSKVASGGEMETEPYLNHMN